MNSKVDLDESPRVRVVIYVPASIDADRYRREAAEHCRRKRYSVDSITTTPEAARRAMVSGVVDRIVVAREHHARDLVPSIEVITQEAAMPSGRRPRAQRIRR